MPKKKSTETQAEQSKRFKAEVRKRVKDGEFDPGEADKTLDALVKRGCT